MSNRTCKNCGTNINHKGPGRPRIYCDSLCKSEFYRTRDHDIDLTSKAEVFWKRIDRSGECWNWQGALDHGGYGRFAPRFSGRMVRIFAHRYSLLLVGIDVPEDQVVDHLCRNRKCVNPAHLEVVDQRENVLRGHSFAAVNAQKQFCDSGHEFTPENTYIRPDREARQCRACIARINREYRARKLAKT